MKSVHLQNIAIYYEYTSSTANMGLQISIYKNYSELWNKYPSINTIDIAKANGNKGNVCILTPLSEMTISQSSI